MAKFLRKLTILALCLVAAQTVSAAWVKQSTGTLSWLRDIHFVTEKRGFIVGGNGTILETSNGGETWTKKPRLFDDNIIQIGFSDEKNGWMLVERNVFQRGDASISYMMRTSDGGETWDRVETNSGRTRLTKIIFNEAGDRFAIGEGGAMFTLRDGSSWTRATNSMRFLLLDGKFNNASNGTLVGGGGSIYFTDDGGSSWNEANVFGEKSGRLNSVFFADQRNGWAVGAQGKVFQTFSGGKTWREQKTGVSADLFDVYFKNTAEGWAVGDQGLILHTTTAGNVWRVVETNIKHKLQKVLFAGGKGFAVGFGGTLLVNGGNAQANQSVTKPVLLRRN